MDKKSIKLFVYPFAAYSFIILSWWAFEKYVLKSSSISILSFSYNISYRNALIFCLFLISMLYFGWASFNIWVENSKNDEEKEKKVEKFFGFYGKFFIGIVLFQFLIIILGSIIILSKIHNIFGTEIEI